MFALVAGRQEGKTTRLFEWVSQGVQAPGYPGWSRAVIVADLNRHDYWRSQYWNALKDFDHRVFTLHDIRHGRFTGRDTEYRIDDLEYLLAGLFPNFNITGFTMTGEDWDDMLHVGRFIDERLMHINPRYHLQVSVLKQCLALINDGAETLGLTPVQSRRLQNLILTGDPDMGQVRPYKTDEEVLSWVQDKMQ